MNKATAKQYNIRKLKRISHSFLRKHEYKGGTNSIHYHLTNEKAFKGILEKDRFILSDFKKTNDNKEFIFLRDIVFDTLRSHTNGKNKKMLDSFLCTYEKFLSNTRLFTASFCGNHSNPTLWSRYGDNERGYALGFSKGLFDYRRRKVTTPDKDIVPVKVKYGKENTLKDIYTFVRVFSEFLKDVQNNEKDNDVGTLFAMTLYAAMPAYKDESWSDEDEHRFYMMNKYPSDRIEFNESDFLGPYFNNIVSLYLSEIIIGKEANLNEKQVRELLPKNCLNVEVKQK